jgi:hypothetical protein
MASEKTPALARHTGNVSATMVLMIMDVALRKILATQMLKVIVSSQNTVAATVLDIDDTPIL